MTTDESTRHWRLLACALVAFSLLLSAPALATQLYFADNNLNTISRVNTDGTAQQVLVNTQRALHGLALDRAAGKMYWSDNGPSFDSSARAGIYRANLDGTGKETLFTASLPPSQQTASTLTVDPATQTLYWLENNTSIRSMNFDGSNVQTVLATSDLGSALEIDQVNGHLYFTSGTFDARNSKIERIDLNGGNRTMIAAIDAFSLALDIASQQIFVADWFNQKVMRLGFDGSGIEQITRAFAIRDVQVFDGQLYYPNVRSEAPDNTGPYYFQWVRSEFDGSNRAVLFEVPRASGPLDMIQFVVVPELSSLSLLTAGLLVLGSTAIAKRKLTSL